MAKQKSESEELDALSRYFLELDRLKLTNRRTYINGGERVENSAEHSWHLAMACWAFAEWFNLDLCQEKLIKLALVHDLGEIDAGDTFLYSKDRSAAHIAEREGVARLAAHEGNGVGELVSLWEEQETGSSQETVLLKAIDRLLPFLHNIHSDGKTWRELQVKKSQVVNAHAFIKQDFPALHRWMSANIDGAVTQGWLIDDS